MIPLKERVKTVLMWQLAMGIVGLLGLEFRSEGFRTVTIIGTGIFLIGAGLEQVYEMVVNGNFALNNPGTMMSMDNLYPLVLAGLLVWLDQWRSESIQE